MSRFESVTLLADDLTGALDSAAALVGTFGALPMRWRAPEAGAGVFDTGLRELPPDAAVERFRAFAHLLAPSPGRLTFCKLDSLLRGHGGAALAAWLREGPHGDVVIAPAFPAQNRRTRQGRQVWLDGSEWRVTGEDLPAILAQAGLAHRVHDAETDGDLDRIVAGGFATGRPVLWVGSAGLAAALARALPVRQTARSPLAGPMLGLIGSDHPVMAAQLTRVEHLRLMLTPDTSQDRAPRICERLERDGVVLATVANPRAMPRIEARRAIASGFARLLRDRPAPGLLFVSGGETLRDVLEGLGAEALHVTGEWEPGMPLSRIEGGRWHGTAVLSKSGGFGQTDCLVRLVETLAKSGNASA